MQAVRNSITNLKHLQMGPAFEIINITHDNCCWIEDLACQICFRMIEAA
jgi:hypothetical protein